MLHVAYKTLRRRHIIAVVGKVGWVGIPKEMTNSQVSDKQNLLSQRGRKVSINLNFFLSRISLTMEHGSICTSSCLVQLRCISMLPYFNCIAQYLLMYTISYE